MVGKFERMKRKAEWQLSQQLVGPLNDWFGPKNREKAHKIEAEQEIIGNRTGIIDLTPEEEQKLIAIRKNLPPEEKARRDPNFLQPEAARNALFALSIFLTLMLILCWFLWTCKNNDNSKQARMQREREEDENEMRNFRGRNEYSNVRNTDTPE